MFLEPKKSLTEKMLQSAACAVGKHRWFYSSSSDWRRCGGCGKEQTTDKRGAPEHWVWRDS